MRANLLHQRLHLFMSLMPVLLLKLIRGKARRGRINDDNGTLYDSSVPPIATSYKKRLKQTDSARCPGCGMDPHAVPHLFNCTAHFIDLTLVNLWDNPVKTIRGLSFLDPDNLD